MIQNTKISPRYFIPILYGFCLFGLMTFVDFDIKVLLAILALSLFGFVYNVYKYFKKNKNLEEIISKITQNKLGIFCPGIKLFLTSAFTILLMFLITTAGAGGSVFAQVSETLTVSSIAKIESEKATQSSSQSPISSQNIESASSLSTEGDSSSSQVENSEPSSTSSESKSSQSEAQKSKSIKKTKLLKLKKSTKLESEKKLNIPTTSGIFGDIDITIPNQTEITTPINEIEVEESNAILNLVSAPIKAFGEFIGISSEQTVPSSIETATSSQSSISSQNREVKITELDANVIIAAEIEKPQANPIDQIEGKNIDSLSFEFGDPSQHLIFSKPVKISVPTELTSDKNIEIEVKHNGDTEYNLSGLTNDPNATCNPDGTTDQSGNQTKWMIVDNQITFYTCGASGFVINAAGAGNLKLWLKGDTGVTATAGKVSAWNDQSGSLNHALQVTAANQPSVVAANTLNYNSTITFDGLNTYLKGLAGYNSAQTFVVIKPTNPITSATTGGPTVLGTLIPDTGFVDETSIALGSNTGRVSGELWSANYARNTAANPYVAEISGTEILDSGQLLEVNHGAGAAWNANRNGRNVGTNNANINSFTNKSYTLGTQERITPANTFANYFNGSIAEVLSFNTQIGASQRASINSYLAAKYGITLGQSTSGITPVAGVTDYVSSTGIKYWDSVANSAYKNRVTVMGRDDAAGTGTSFNQKMAKSVHDGSLVQINNYNTTPVNPLTFGTTNTANLHNITNDNSFLAFGDDNGPLTWSTTNAPEGTQILGRKFKVQNTNFSATNYPKFRVPGSATTEATKLPLEYGNDTLPLIYLLVDNDNNGIFELKYSMPGTGNYWVFNSTPTLLNLNNNAVFTFGTKAPVTVTIDQSSNQPDPQAIGTTSTFVDFDVKFNQPINTANFTSTDITLGGNASGCTFVSISDVFATGKTFKARYDCGSSASNNSKTLTASIAAGAVDDGFSGILNQASTSTDNQVSLLTIATPNYVCMGGVTGNYYQRVAADFTTPPLAVVFAGTPQTRLDPTINFNYTNTPGVGTIGADYFTTRWVGNIVAPTTGNYVLQTNSDDGVRVYLNGILIINNWTDHGPVLNNSVSIPLIAGVPNTFVMEYYEKGGGAVAALNWSLPAAPATFVNIPTTALCNVATLPLTVTVNQASTQPDPAPIDAIGAIVEFDVVFNQSVQPASFTASDILITGTATGCNYASSSNPLSDNKTFIFRYNCGTSPTNNTKTVIANIAANSVLSSFGANNAASTFTDNTVTLLTAPTIPSIPDMTTGTDTGSSNNDNITNSTNPAFTGTCVTGETIKLFVDNIAILPTQVCSAGAYTITPSTAITTGAHNITATASINGFNSTQTIALPIVIDTTSPFAPPAPDLTTDTGSSAIDNITKTALSTFVGACNNGETVTLFDGTNPIGSAICASLNYSITLVTALTDGLHNIATKFTDLAGNISSSSPNLTVTVDTVAPALTINTPSIINIANQNSYTLSGTCEIGGTNVGVILGNMDVQTPPCSATGTWTTTFTGINTWFADGNNISISAAQSDTAGNGANATATTTKDTVAPTAPTLPDLTTDYGDGINLSYFTDNITNQVLPNFAGSCNNGETVTLFNGAASVGSMICASLAYSITLVTALANGIYNFTTKFTDLAGNISGASPNLQVTINTIAPTPTINTPAIIYSGNTTNYPLSGTCSSYDSFISVRVGTSSNTAFCNSGIWSTTFPTLTSLADSPNVPVEIKQRDRAGNNAIITTSVLKDTIAPAALGAPDMTAATDTYSANPLLGSNTDNTTGNNTPTFTGSCVNGDTIQLQTLYSGGFLQPTQVCTGSVYTISLTTVLESYGNYIVAYATDLAGNRSVIGNGLYFSIKTAIPISSIPDMTATTDTGASNTDNLTKNTTPTFTGTCESGTVNSIYIDNILTINPIPCVSGNYTYNQLSPLSSGNHTIAIKPVDLAGNTPPSPSAPLNFVIDTSTPAAANCTASPNPTNNSTAVVINCSGVEIGASLTIPGTTCTPSPATATGLVTCTGTTNSSVLANPTATVTDQAGNFATSAAALTIDTINPTVTVEQKIGQPDPTYINSLKYTITFSEDVNTGTFSASDLIIGTSPVSSGLYVNSFTQLTSKIWEVEIKGMPNLYPTFLVTTVSIAANSVKDIAGNDNQASTSVDNSISFRVPPPSINPINSNTTTPTLTGGCNPGNTMQISIVVAGQSYTTICSPTGTWSVTLTTPLTQGTFDVIVEDLTNPGLFDLTTNEIFIDSIVPTVTVNQKAGQADPTNVNNIKYTITITDQGGISPSTFTINDINSSGSSTGTVTGLTQISNSGGIAIYEATVTGLTSGETMTLSIPANRFQDFGGNNNTTSTSTDNSVTFDNTPPPVPSCIATPAIANPDIVIYISCANVNNGDTITIPGATCVVNPSQSNPTTASCVGNAPGSIASNPTATATDPAGNTNASIVSLIINPLEFDVKITHATSIPSTSFTQSSPIFTTQQGVFRVEFSKLIDGTTLTASDFNFSNPNHTAIGCVIDEVDFYDNGTDDYFVTVHCDNVLSNNNKLIILSINPSSVNGQLGGTNNTLSSSGNLDLIFNDYVFEPTIDLSAGQSAIAPTSDTVKFAISSPIDLDPWSFTMSDIVLSQSTATGCIVENLERIDAKNYEARIRCDDITSNQNKTVVINFADNTVFAIGGTQNANTTIVNNSVTFLDTTASPAPVINTIANNPASPTTPALTNDNTPTITGTGTIGDTIKVFSDLINNVVACITTVDSNGNWTCDINQLLDGIYDLFAIDIDPSGNESTPSNLGKLKIDTTPPSQPTVTQVGEDLRPGIIATTDNTPTITGVCEAGTQVNVTISPTTEVLLAICTIAGTYSVTSNIIIPDGLFAINVNSTDAAGNVSSSLFFTGIVDTVVPQAPVISQVAEDVNPGTLITNDKTPTITGTCEANTTVNIYISPINESLTTTCSAAGTFSVRSTNDIPDRQYAIAINQSDYAGNVSTPSLINFEIDTNIPAAPAITRVAEDTIPGTLITNDNTPTINGTCETGATVNIIITPTNEAISVLCVNNAYSITPTSSISDGPFTISIAQTDPAGNTSPATTINGTIDTVSPAAPVILTTAGQPANSTTPVLTNDNTPTITGTATLGSTLSVFFQSTNSAIGFGVNINPDGTWSFDAGLLPDNLYTIEAYQVDLAGNVSAISNLPKIQIGTSAVPAIGVTQIGEDSYPGVINTTNNQPAVQGTCVAGNVVNMNISPLGTTQQFACPVNGIFSQIINGPILDGAFSVSLTQTNAFGTVSQPTNINGNVDTVLPVLTISSAPTINGANETTYVFSGTCTIGDGDVGTQIGGITSTVPCSPTGTWTSQITDASAIFDNGAVLIVAFQTDAAGNVGQTNAFPLKDTESPTITINQKSGQADPTNVNEARFTVVTDMGTGSDLLASSLTQSDFNLAGTTLENINSLTLVSHVVNIYTYEILVSNIQNGEAVTLTMAANKFQDIAGNGNTVSTSTDNSVTYIRTPTIPSIPDLANTSDTGFSNTDNLTNASNLILNGTCTTGELITIFDNGLTQSPTQICTNSAYSITIPSPNDGDYNFTATSTNFGQESPQSRPLSIFVDTEVPEILDTPNVTNGTDSNINSDNITNDNTPTIDGLCQEADSYITLVVNGVNQVPSVLCDSNNQYSFTIVNPLPEGNITVEAFTTDIVGNVGAISQALIITIDTLNPQTPIITQVAEDGLPGQIITNDNTPTVTGTCETGSTITLVVNSDGSPQSTICINGTFSITISPSLPNSINDLDISQADIAGNTSQVVRTNVTVDTSIPSTPSASITTPANDNTPTITGACEVGSIVSVTILPTNEILSTTCTNGTYTVTANNQIPDGSFIANITQTDSAGNTSLATVIPGNIDTLAPSSPVVNQVGEDILPGVINTTDSTPTIIGACENGAVANITITPGNESLSSLCVNGNYSFTPVNPIVDGPFSVTLSQTDPAGNVSPSTIISGNVDTSIPNQITLNTPTPTNDNTPTITGNCEAGATVNLIITPTNEPISIICLPTGIYTVTPVIQILDGAFTITGTQIDTAGNVSPSTIISGNVDTSIPNTPSVTQIGEDVLPGTINSTDSTPTISGMCETGTTVNVTVSPTNENLSTACVNNTYSITPVNPIGDGTFAITVTQSDPAGNISSSTVINGNIDTGVPTAPVVTQVGEDTLPSVLNTNDNTPTIVGTCENGAMVKVEVTPSNQVLSSLCVNGTYSITPSTVISDGPFTITATQTDPAGNVSPSTILTGTINTTPSSDDDSDGIPTSVENIGPNNGDGNNDGTKDALQSNVVSMPDAVTTKYVVLSTNPNDVCKNFSAVNVNTEPQNIILDDNYDYPVGFVNFTAPCSTSITVNMLWYGLDSNQTYTNRKFKINGQVYSIASGIATSIRAINSLPVLNYSYTVVDNGTLDDDPTVGIIKDPIGPAQLTSRGGVITISEQTSSIQSSNLTVISESQSSTLVSILNIQTSLSPENTPGKGENTIRTGGQPNEQSLDPILRSSLILMLIIIILDNAYQVKIKSKKE